MARVSIQPLSGSDQRLSESAQLSWPEPTTDESRVVIVTAAGKGMGEAIARRLHSDGHRLGLMLTTLT